MSIVLVVNSGSSSFKYQLLDMSTEEVLAHGLVERIGEPTALVRHVTGRGEFERTTAIPDHAAGFAAMLEGFAEHGPALALYPPTVVGHRVVHGGHVFDRAAVVDEGVEVDIAALEPLAPLHNPANLAGIRGAMAAFPDVPHVAVFDTAFHRTMPESAATYAIDREVAQAYGVHRYGAHGTSHKYVAGATAEFLGRSVDQLRTIVFHIGNGASACAVDGGESVDTSMGMTPLEGLVMGTRSGDIDPAVTFHLARIGGYDVDGLDDLLNRRSGLLGMAGSGDMRDVRFWAEAGDEHAQRAIDVYVHRIRHYLGAYLVSLGGADAIAFTAGVGENAVELRRDVLRGLEWLGIELDEARNASPDRGARLISTDTSRIAVLVVPTNEELEIARQSLEAIGG